MHSSVFKAGLVVGLSTSFGLGSMALANGDGSQATVQELRRIIEQQQRQLEQQAQTLEALRQQVQALDRTVQESAAPVAAAPADIPPGVARSGQERIGLSVSGQINRGVLFADDGEDTEVFHVDNDNSSTRVRLVGEGKLNDDLTLGAQIEVQFESNSTAAVNQRNQRNVGPNNFTERKLELYFDSKRLGRLWVGQGDTASNGSAEMDLSGADVVGYSGVSDMAGGILFRNADTGELTDIAIGDAFSNFDGLSRDDRVRYDSPVFGGFKVSASAIADDRWDVALRHTGSYGGLQVAAAAAYADPHLAAVDSIVDGSVSVLHDSGFNVTAAAGGQDRDDRDPWFWYIKFGYLAKLSSLGTTAFAVDYTESEEVAALDSEAKAYGFFVVQELDGYGTQLYLGFRNHELDLPGLNTDDVFATLAGARIKF